MRSHCVPRSGFDPTSAQQLWSPWFERIWKTWIQIHRRFTPQKTFTGLIEGFTLANSLLLSKDMQVSENTTLRPGPALNWVRHGQNKSTYNGSKKVCIVRCLSKRNQKSIIGRPLKTGSSPTRQLRTDDVCVSTAYKNFYLKNFLSSQGNI